jgi:hypothetical protein
MKLHVSLRWPMSVLLILIWSALALFSLRVSAGAAFVLIAPAMLVGLAAGAMQAASMRDAPDTFRRARSAMDVRRAFAGTVWGARYLVLFWAAQTLFLVVALAMAWPLVRQHEPSVAAFQVVWVLASLYSGFAITRELVAMFGLSNLK